MTRAFTVYYREHLGEVADIQFSEEFKKESTLMQADVIGDLIHDLTEKYNSYVQRGIVGGERISNAKISRKESSGKRRSRPGKNGPSERAARP